MEIRTEYDKDVQQRIKEIRDEIYEVELIYLERIDQARTDYEAMKIRNNMYNDVYLRFLYKKLNHVIEYALPLYYVRVENDEEKQWLEKLATK